MTADFQDRTAPKQSFWSPLSDSDVDVPVQDLLNHPRVLLDPAQVLPTPEPSEPEQTDDAENA